MRRPTYRTSLTADETKQLEQLIRKSTAPQHLVRRAKIILMANGEGKSNQVIAEALGITSSKVSLWTKRWIDRAGDSLEERLSDLARSGAPCRITPEQWCCIMAVCCTPPQEYDYPITHWTGRELANEVVKQGIVESLSVSHLNDFLKKRSSSHTAPAIG